MIQPVIDIRNLRIEAEEATLGSAPIVRDINLTVMPGEVHALIGESGSGKTTVALTALGHVRPGLKVVSGEARLNGKDLFSMKGDVLRGLRGTQVSYVAQSAAASFNPSIRIGDQVIEPAVEHGLMSHDAACMRAMKLYEELRIPVPGIVSRRFPHEVSGGQLQRLMAAMAMVPAPELIVFDEPTTALDVTTQLSVLMSFRSLIRQHQTAAVYVAHDLAVVAQIADRATVLLNGEIKEEGPISRLIRSPKAAYTRALMEAADQKVAPAAEAANADLPSGSVLKVRHVDAGYGGRRADGSPRIPVLHDVSLSLKKRSILGLIGESGSGKSTIAQVIAGLLPAARGEVSIDGHAVAPRIENRSKDFVRRIQIVSQNADTALNPSQTVERILGRPLVFFHGLKGRAMSARVEELLDLVSLPPEMAQRRPHELSGGQKQRINLARALAAAPDIILCDEVTSALDTIVRNSIVDLIGELRLRLNVSIVFISHDISTVARVTDQVAVMFKGRIVESGDTTKVLSEPQHAYTRLLLSSVPKLEPGWLDEAYDRVRAEQDSLAQKYVTVN